MSHVDENDALYHRIRSGDKAAIDEMIERNMPLAKSRVTEFLKDYRRFRHLREDLQGEGFFALTKAVQSFATTEVEKPTGYIVSAIDFALSDYIDSEIGAGMMPVRTVQRRRSNGESLPEQLPFDVAKPPAQLWREPSGHVTRKELPSDSQQDTFAVTEPIQFGTPSKSKVSHSDAEQFIDRFEQAGTAPDTDILDQILACCESEQDETIVRLRIKGYTDDEIGEQIGVSRATVQRRRAAIEDRFDLRS